MKIKVTAPVRVDISAGWPDSDPYRKDFGGAVLNAAIDMRVRAEFDNFLKTDYWQAKSYNGLGASGAIDAAWLVVRNPELLNDRQELIRNIWDLENRNVMHRAGTQDQAAAIYGGVNLWEFGQGPGETASIRRTAIEIKRAEKLQDKLILVDIGRPTISSNIHNFVFGHDNYEKNIPKLDRMKEIAVEMYASLENDSEMINLIRETWNLQKSLHKSIENPAAKVLERSIDPYFSKYALRETGSGGCAIIFAPEKEDLVKYINSLIRSKSLPKEIKIIPFKFEYKGIKIEKS